MCFSGYRNDMFLVFDCNPVQYEFIYGMVQIVSVLIIYITFFYGYCTSEIFNVVYTKSADFCLLYVSMVGLKSMFIKHVCQFI